MSHRVDGSRLLKPFALALLPFVAFATSLSCGFVWLDHTEIVDGAYRVRDTGDLSRMFSESLDAYTFRDQGDVAVQGGYWRPLYGLSISLDWWFWGDRSRWYHLENIAWHSVTVVLLYWLGLCLARQNADGRFAAFWAAALFAVHPTNLQSVTWISGRKDVLCACFAVGAILVSNLNTVRRPALLSCISAGLFALALGFKELAIVVPIFLGVQQLTRQFGSTTPPSDAIVARRKLTLLLTGVTAAVWLAYRSVVVRGIGLNVPQEPQSWAEWIATHTSLWLHYVVSVVQPIPPMLSDRWPTVSLISVTGVLSTALFALAVAWLVRMWRRSDLRLICVLWFLIWMLPASNIVPLRHVHAERYLYPASWGLLMFGVWSLRNALKFHVRLRDQLPYLCSAVVLLWGILTAWESLNWYDDSTLFSRAIARDPGYVEGHFALASRRLEQEKYQAAAELSEVGILLAERQASPGYWSPLIARTNYGLALYHLKRPQEALQQFRRAQQLQPQLPLVHYHVGLAALAIPDYDLAAESLRRAYELQPGDDLTASNLAFALLQSGDAEGCLEILLPVVRRTPDDVSNQRNTGTALLLLNRFSEALPHLLTAARLSGDDAGDLARVAWAHWGADRKSEAEDWLERAMRISDVHPTVQFVRRLMTTANSEQGRN